MQHYLKARYRTITSKISTYYHDKIKPYQGRIIAAIVATVAALATLSLAGWIYAAMAVGAISVAGAAVSIPGIILMAAIIALCIYLVGVNSDHHYRENQERHHHAHKHYHRDHVVDSTHATVQSTLNANPTTPSTNTADVPVTETNQLHASSSSSSSIELNTYYEHRNTVAENRAPSPD